MAADVEEMILVSDRAAAAADTGAIPLYDENAAALSGELISGSEAPQMRRASPASWREARMRELTGAKRASKIS